MGIKIKKSNFIGPKAKVKKITKEKFLKEIYEHRDSVSDCLNFFVKDLIERGMNHDYTKLKFFDLFYSDTVESRLNKDLNFKEMKFYKKHIEERHHLNAKVPENVNLIDILEMVADCVSAGISRDGNFRESEIQLDPELLQKAVNNTAKILLENINTD